MTVVEIIKRLKNFSPDAEVKVVYQGDNPFLTANPIGEIYEIKGHNEGSGVYLEIQKLNFAVVALETMNGIMEI